MDLTEYACRVLDSFDLLRKLLAERAECGEDEIVVYDEPLQLVIKRDRIDFFVEDEYHGMVGRDHVSLSDEVAEEARMWLQGLASLRFKRFSVRR